jgi:hypothetical protein
MGNYVPHWFWYKALLVQERNRRDIVLHGVFRRLVRIREISVSINIIFPSVLAHTRISNVLIKKVTQRRRNYLKNLEIT